MKVNREVVDTVLPVSYQSERHRPAETELSQKENSDEVSINKAEEGFEAINT